MGNRIQASIVADSITEDGSRIISIQVCQPRIILAETNTHKVFSLSSSSSRAVPVRKVLGQVWKDPFVPVKFGSHQAGMQSGPPLRGWRKWAARTLWITAGKVACVFAWAMLKVGLAKEVANRVLEPWQWTSTVITSTCWQNFFNLRCHPDAQPEMQALAWAIVAAIQQSTPESLKEGQWHLPYIRSSERERLEGTPDEWLLPVMSAARCARTSYNNMDGTNAEVSKDRALFERLVISRPAHASPMAHQARVDSTLWASRNFLGSFKQFREIMELEGIGGYPALGDTSELK